MASQNPNMDQFEAYFRRADLDGDGRISGTEAVAFFQGSNLPKQVLAQIWMHADQSRTGFLGRAEFYNALKLVTVAQSKRDLTPEMVKAALYGPAASKIPPPQINLASMAGHQVNQGAAASGQQIGTVTPTASQNFGLRGPGVPNTSINQHYFTNTTMNQQTQLMRPPQAIPPSTASHPPQGPPHPEFSAGGSMMGHSQAMLTNTAPRPPQLMPGGNASLSISNSNISTDWFSERTGGALIGPRGVTPHSPSAAVPQKTLAPVSSQPTVSDSKSLVVSGNGFAANSFGSDAFSVISSTIKQEPRMPAYSASSTPSSSVSVSSGVQPPVKSISSGVQPPVKSNSLESLQSAFTMQPLGGQIQRAQSLPSSGLQVSTPAPSSLASPAIPVGVGNSSDNTQIPWPKMKSSDVQKYTKVFMEVDTDRDGRITGEQARNLFLSWRLPREVLKQVWDLSDQDSDSMLSLREFCFALYLMERYREGRPLPAALPNTVLFDETLMSMTGQPKVTYSNAAWGPSPGYGQQLGTGPRPLAPPAGSRPPVPVTAPQADGAIASSQNKSRTPVLEDSFLNQSVNGDLNTANLMPQDGMASEEKANKTEKVILDSREKIEFYRSKMQDLVLYKSRCDNRLNEITERAIADKREAELLGKKYEDKYKQVAEVASKLTIEEATFRDIQERKLELQQAIVNMEQGGSADGLLQVRADRIQSDLDELMKALTERCKKFKIDVKSAATLELPFGWQPGIQEGAAVWDEDWDKFEDEGFSNEVAIDVKNVPASSNPVQEGKISPNGSITPDSLSDGHGRSGNFMSPDNHGLENESAYTHSEDELARSPQGSPAGRSALESPSKAFSDVFVKSSEADGETHRSFDESTWGAFDTNDDTDSIWGFNTTKDSNSEKNRDFFGSGGFGIEPIRTESPSAESVFRKRSPFFEDSVPGTPLSKFGNSPRYSEAGDHFDNFSTLDSFSMHEGAFSPRERLTRFDSINSTKDFGHSRAFSSFDDSDPFGSSGPFKVSSDNQTPKRDSGNWGAF